VRLLSRPSLLLAIALALQACLLFSRLDLLPEWDDERYTLQTASRAPAGIIEAVEVDVHPPLYYLLVHVWLRMPGPGEALLRVRALSVLLALAATCIFWRLWLHGWPARRQAFFLGLWALSPGLILYARIGRSYMLQMLLAIVALWLARRWLAQPDDRRAAAGYVLATAALLYTHYLPGLAVAGAVALVGLARRDWRHLAAATAIGVLYAPWLHRLWRAATLVAESDTYRTASNWAVENVLRLGYAFVVFHFGESPPPWTMLLGLAVAPGIVWAWRRSWKASDGLRPLLLLAAGLGYGIAASWVSFAFVGARLLFLLPFYYLFLVRGLDQDGKAGRLLYAALLLAAAGSLTSYYRQQDFLNKGYLINYGALVRTVQHGSRGSVAHVLLDRPLAYAGSPLHAPNIPQIRILWGEPERQRALRRIERDQPPLVWHLHYTREAPQAAARLWEQLQKHYEIRRHGFVPYSRLDHWAMERLGIRPPPDYVVEVLEFRRKL
jgi:hypothetical protein